VVVAPASGETIANANAETIAAHVRIARVDICRLMVFSPVDGDDIQSS
jgi:hypothetical protein